MDWVKVPAAVAIPPTVVAPTMNPMVTFEAVLVKRISLSRIPMSTLSPTGAYISPLAPKNNQGNLRILCELHLPDSWEGEHPGDHDRAEGCHPKEGASQANSAGKWCSHCYTDWPGEKRAHAIKGRYS